MLPTKLGSFGQAVSEEKIFLGIDQSASRTACGGHVCEPLVYILYCIICMLMFHHACLSFSIKSLRYFVCEILSCIYGCYLIILHLIYLSLHCSSLGWCTQPLESRLPDAGTTYENVCNVIEYTSNKYFASMLMFHHACLSFSIKSLRNNLCYDTLCVRYYHVYMAVI
jgi:hypothetical protein